MNRRGKRAQFESILEIRNNNRMNLFFGTHIGIRCKKLTKSCPLLVKEVLHGAARTYPCNSLGRRDITQGNVKNILLPQYNLQPAYTVTNQGTLHTAPAQVRIVLCYEHRTSLVQMLSPP